jgi:hypothetical protein
MVEIFPRGKISDTITCVATSDIAKKFESLRADECDLIISSFRTFENDTGDTVGTLACGLERSVSMDMSTKIENSGSNKSITIRIARLDIGNFEDFELVEFHHVYF